MLAGSKPHAILKHLVLVYSKLYPSYASTICQEKPLAVRASGTWAGHFCCEGHHGERKHHHACRFRPNLQYYLLAVGVALQQGTSFICKYHLVAEALGCQCKWYLGRSPLLCRSTAVNRMQVHTKLAIPFNSRGHLGHLFAVKTCLSGKGASTCSFQKHLARNSTGHHGVQKHQVVSWLSVQVVLGQVTFAVQEQQGERQHLHACRFTPNLQYHSIVEAISAT